MTKPPTDQSNNTIEQLNKLATLLDSQFAIPGTRIRFGLDAILGLIPGAGDAIGALLSLWVVISGIRMGASIGSVFKMLINIGIELVLGAVPLLGDIFDVAWQANNRNVTLLREELAPETLLIEEASSNTEKQQARWALLALIVLLGTALLAYSLQ